MSSRETKKSNDGISKQPHPKSTSNNPSKLEQLEQMVNDGSMSQGNRTAEQATISQGHRQHEKSSNTQDDIQGQSKTPKIPEESRAVPPSGPAVESIEPNDIEMQEFHSEDSAGASSISNRQGMPGSGDSPHRRDVSSSKAHSNDSFEDPECLATLGSLPGDEDGNHVLDGWGTLRGSTFVILQYGPLHGAKFKAKYKSGFNTHGMSNISDRRQRISELRDEDGRGKRTFRYSGNNVVGIYGVAFEERKYPNKVYKCDPCVWVKIKWKDLREGDKEGLSRGCSWIPRSDFSRLCGSKDAAESKIKEVWDKQEQRYLRWLQNDPGRGDDNRSPTPCPLNAYTNQPGERRATARSDTPVVGHDWKRNKSIPLSSPGFNNAEGSKSNPVKIDGVRAPGFSGLPDSTSANKTVRAEADVQAEKPQITFTKNEFMAARAEREKWDDLDELEREKRIVIADALYLIHRKTMMDNGATEIPDRLQNPAGDVGGAIAAH